MNILKIILLILLVIQPVLTTPVFATETMQQNEEEDKIQFLIQKVKESDVTFVRNGHEYQPAEAAKHLASKRHAYGTRIKTAQAFIDHVASASYVTGKPYYVKFSDGHKIETREWLDDQLKTFHQP